MKGSIGGLIVGVILFMLALFINQAMPVYLPDLSQNILDTAQTLFLILGFAGIFVGALHRD